MVQREAPTLTTAITVLPIGTYGSSFFLLGFSIHPI